MCPPPPSSRPSPRCGLKGTDTKVRGKAHISISMFLSTVLVERGIVSSSLNLQMMFRSSLHYPPCVSYFALSVCEHAAGARAPACVCGYARCWHWSARTVQRSRATLD